MGATIYKNIIYIDKKLNNRITPGERRVLYAHEIWHKKSHDRIKILLITLFLFWCPKAINAFRRYLELRADSYALKRTKDFKSFILLMDKLSHDSSTHPTKESRIYRAQLMKGEIV